MASDHAVNRTIRRKYRLPFRNFRKRVPFAVLQAHVRHVPDLKKTRGCGRASPRRRSRRHLDAPDLFENLAEQVARYGHLCHLEDDISGMPHYLGTDLYQLIPQRRQRPFSHPVWKRQSPKEVRQVVGQQEELQTNLVVIFTATARLPSRRTTCSAKPRPPPTSSSRT